MKKYIAIWRTREEEAGVGGGEGTTKARGSKARATAYMGGVRRAVEQGGRYAARRGRRRGASTGDEQTRCLAAPGLGALRAAGDVDVCRAALVRAVGRGRVDQPCLDVAGYLRA